MLRLKSASRKTGSEVMINMMPMVDVVFLLLIFFLLTSIVVTQPVLDLSLPVAAHSKTMEEGPVIQVVIQKEGQIEIDQKPIDLDALEAFLKARLGSGMKKGRKKRLLLTADRDAPFGVFVEVLDRVQGLGVKDMAIMTKAPEESP